MALAAAGGIVVLGLVAPFVNASRLSGPIQRALEASLGREVTFEKVHFKLFSGPGFSLENVTIGEDSRYGIEPFAFVPSLDVGVRLDKLLLGTMRLSSLRLVDPSLNLVKRNDGGWNIVELVQRLAIPRRGPLNFFPALTVSQGRINFKLATRKTTLYLMESDLSIYPARSGKLYVQFSGSPARTDRAGNGFGHLRGTANWYFNPASAAANQLEADVTLDPSNLSELATLFEGHDLGVHGTISGRARVAGPAAALKIAGEFRLADVHRWDLLPSSGEDWRIRYSGDIDLRARRLDLETVPLRAGDVSPVAVQMQASDFFSRPAWSVSVRFNNAAVQDLLPLGRRMGMPLPQDLALNGALAGTVAYSNTEGLSGSVSIRDAKATLPDIPPLRSAVVDVNVLSDRIHFAPAVIETGSGTLTAGGDYYFSTSGVLASLGAEQLSTQTLKRTINAWFGEPAALSAFSEGHVTGQFAYQQQAASRPVWSGQFQFSDATLSVPGVAVPIHQAQGHVTFDDTNFDLSHFSANVGDQLVRGTYRYSALAKRPERIHLELASVDLEEVEHALEPTLEAQGLLARLRLSRRSIPAWLTARNLEGDAAIERFSVNQANLGPLRARFVWQGTNIQFTGLQLNLPEGLIRARGSVNIASYSPHYRFSAKVTGFPWRGGFLNADGEFDGSGTGLDSLQNLQANGSFSGEDVTLSADDTFSRVSGLFKFSFRDGWPNLRLSKIQASDGEEAWSGEAASQSDGRLILDLEHAGRQRRVVSTLTPERSAVSTLLDINR